MNNSSGGGGNFMAAIGLIAMIVIAIASGSGGGSSASSKYDQDFKSGMEKYYNGEKMNRDEYNAVKNFNDWKAKNSDHSYDDWK